MSADERARAISRLGFCDSADIGAAASSAAVLDAHGIEDDRVDGALRDALGTTHP